MALPTETPDRFWDSSLHPLPSNDVVTAVERGLSVLADRGLQAATEADGFGVLITGDGDLRIRYYLAAR
jgi:hypothetical protein